MMQNLNLVSGTTTSMKQTQIDIVFEGRFQATYQLMINLITAKIVLLLEFQKQPPEVFYKERCS